MQKQLIDSMRSACDWLVDTAQLKSDDLPPDTVDRLGVGHKSWKGAIRGEYSAAERMWWFFGPMWHTGQAVKALVSASNILNDEKYLQGARAGAAFILDEQVWDGGIDHGLMCSFEGDLKLINTSCTLEAMQGLMILAEHDRSDEMWERIVGAGEFLLNRMYIHGKGVYHDLYDPAARSIHPAPPGMTKDEIGGRPLLDDSIMLRLYEKTGDERFLRVQVEVSERLVEDQDPPGNWVDYAPCDAKRGMVHPRQAYWWGTPLIDTYRKTGRREFLQTAIASGEFCRCALRRDGGFFRSYYTDGKTDSFDHATSGSACSAILFLELFRETREICWREDAELALEYCMNVQFREPADPNLRGAILEKVLPPDGTDRSPYHIRDLGTIFFIMAGEKYLEIQS